MGYLLVTLTVGILSPCKRKKNTHFLFIYEKFSLVMKSIYLQILTEVLPTIRLLYIFFYTIYCNRFSNSFLFIQITSILGNHLGPSHLLSRLNSNLNKSLGRSKCLLSN